MKRRMIAERPLHLLTISAETEAALHSEIEQTVAWLHSQNGRPFGEIAAETNAGTHHAWRVGMVAESAESAIKKLTSRRLKLHNAPAQPAPIAFALTGQGSQYLQMGRALYESDACFRATLDLCDTLAQPHLGRSLLALIYPDAPPDHDDLMTSHPVGAATTFAIQCALVEMLRAWGVQADMIVGHSLGDFAAAVAVGVLSLADGMKIVCERGRLMQQAVGAMISVLATIEDVTPLIAEMDDVAIGVINSPTSIVVSGGSNNIEQVEQQLIARGFKTRKLDIPMAAHSPMLDPVLDPFEQCVASVALAPPAENVTVISSMLGREISAELTHPTYWRDHLRQPVRFADAVDCLFAMECDLFVEIGSNPTLLGIIRLLDAPQGRPTLLPTLRKGKDDWGQLLKSIATLYERGVAINWAAFNNVELPTNQ